jgi:tRNA U34 5-carboxymethylaminomethyl modifying GTPase MnmE/TrmE
MTGAGIPQLLSQLDGLVRERFAAPEGALVNERQSRAVTDCATALSAALASLTAGLDEQIVVVDLRTAASALGSLIGDVTRDEVFAEIFGKFCIGK